jgi:UDP-N-acetylglucosamine--N-acetylmuramyl-(pentapeptide) pyrophosphoryl-undecaprenol N-acetylglucosamine transferase
VKLAIAGGGTGGHLFPGIAVAESLLRLDSTAEVLFIGTERGIETRAVPRAGFRLELIRVGALKRVSGVERVKTIASIPTSILHARRILRTFGASAVLGVGGYASGPALVAARIMGLPTAICEQNSVPGMTNRILGRLVDDIFGTFESARPHFPVARYSVVGNPVRVAFVDAVGSGAGTSPEPGRVFVFGGSQGARPLNQAVPDAIAMLRAQGASVEVHHQTGTADLDDVRQAYRAHGVSAQVDAFVDDMVGAYRRADVVVCRAGATSCAELTALGVPAVLVPFPQAADDHQTKNAAELASRGAAILLPQRDLTPARLASELNAVMADRDRRAQMAAASLALGRLDAGAVIAQAACDGFNFADRVRARREKA